MIILEVPNVEGECTVSGHEKQIDCAAISLGAQQMVQTGQGNRTAGTVSIQNISLTRMFDSASVTLLDKMITGTSCGTCKIHFLKAGGVDNKGQDEFLTVTLDEVLISSWQMSDSSGSDPVESLTLDFVKITWEYKPQGKEGKMGGVVPTNFDLLLGEKA